MRVKTWTAALPAIVLVAAACGSDDDTSSDEAATDATTAEGATDDGSATSDLEGTLRVLIHQNPPGVAFMENFNSEFEAANPGVTIDMSVVNADDIPTVNQTRLNANDIDVTTISVTGFANPVQPYMTDADTPYWQQLIEAGLLMDLSASRSSRTTTRRRSTTVRSTVRCTRSIWAARSTAACS
jgi:raffinose/stachyose/melibiose transport system substrate-binding protein